MPNEKISAMPPAGALAGTEEVPIVQAAANVRTTAQAIANLAAGGGPSIQPINTGAVNTIDTTSAASVIVVEVTTSGLAHTDTLNLPLLPFTNGINPQRIGQIVVVYITALTNPADALGITVAGSVLVNLDIDPTNYGIQPAHVGTITPGVLLNNINQVAVFRWCGDRWYWDQLSGNFTDASTYSTQDIIIQPTGTLDNIYLQQTSGGNIYIPLLPSADPGYAGALFTVGAPAPGVPKALMVSGG
jgi:hypothetical protein